MTYEINYRDNEGNEVQIEGETLESLASQLKAQGYEGSSIRVRDEQGSTKGWVSAGDWRAA